MTLIKRLIGAVLVLAVLSLVVGLTVVQLGWEGAAVLWVSVLIADFALLLGMFLLFGEV